MKLAMTSGGRCGAVAGRPGVAARAAGFTLIELVTAMALAVVIMMGIAQVFKMATDTASEAEQISDSYQMGRGLMGWLQSDISQFSSDGYLFIVPQRMVGKTPPTGNKPRSYRYFGLYFTAVGKFDEIGPTTKIKQNPAIATGAEIAYMPGLRNEIAGSTMKKGVWVGGVDADTDARVGLIIRKAYLLSKSVVKDHGTTPLVPLDAVFAAGPTKPSSCFAMMAGEADATLTTPKWRLAPILVSNLDAKTALQTIESEGAKGVYAEDVEFIVADRVSEFFVEYWGYNSKAANGGAWQWCMPGAPPSGTGETANWPAVSWPPTDDAKYKVDPLKYESLWGANAGQTVKATKDKVIQPFMPSMIRVTAVVHPHSDTIPLADEPYQAGGGTAATGKYRGTVFRQVFHLPNGLDYAKKPL